jgi:hypothetical protein
MADLIAALSTQTGIDPETTQKGLGALLTFLKGQLGPEAFGKVESAVPGSEGLLSAFESGAGSSGQGLLGAVTGLAGKLLGGQAGEGANLVSLLSRSGLEAGQIQAFLPKAFELLQNYLPPDLVGLIKTLIPQVNASSGAKAD